MFLLTKQIKKIKKVQVKQEKPENKQTTTGTIRFGQKKKNNYKQIIGNMWY